ncbi:MAG: hypothetical protein LBN94_03140 [Puniceicoccales bacterium]|jgi:serine/threonine protein kinase|nr:hypothetical protein [Puniceicoccales bacterium]
MEDLDNVRKKLKPSERNPRLSSKKSSQAMASPFPMALIRKRAKITLGKKLKEGGVGIIYRATVKDATGKIREIIAKKAKPGAKGAQKYLQQEADVGQALIDLCRGVKGNVLCSDIQGLETIVVPVMRKNDTVIQEKIEGANAWEAIYSTKPLPIFANGFIDDPQKTIERICGLVLGLHSLHRIGKVHHDLKLKNIMFERQKDGAGEEYYRIRIIDLGGTVPMGENARLRSRNGAPEYISPRPNEKKDRIARSAYDLYSLGTMLPTLLFGRGTEWLLDKVFWAIKRKRKRTRVIPSPFVQVYRKIEKASGIEKAKERMDQFVLECFQKMNKAMQEKINQCYPEPVLERLAAMTADCLSMDPEKRPTAEQMLLQLQNFALSDWNSGSYSIS